ncbi:hypothetical protein B0H19DRAFT_963666, partial [Mycena capillaripes]
EREVPHEDGAALAQRLGSEFTEASPKTAKKCGSIMRGLRQARDAAVLNHARQKSKKKCIIL